jgi:hypothetical protein
VIAVAGLALGPRQCVFLTAAWMQEYRKILAYWAVPERKQFIRRCADYHVIAIDHRSLEQGIAHRAAD